MKLDKKLLIRLNNGEEAAFKSIYWMYSSHVFHFINSLLYDKSQAEDLTQNVFLKIWEKHKTINPKENFDAYLFTIARNLVYKETENRFLSESALQALGKQLTNATENLTEENIDAESLREYVNKLIEQLPPARREIFQLSRKAHLSNKEIAIRLNLAEKTVETQLYRSLCFLKEKLSSSNLLTLLYLLLINKG